MTIPTSGSFSGIDIYQLTNATGVGGAVGTSLVVLENAIAGLGLGDVSTILASLAAVYVPVETASTVTFSGTTITTTSDAGAPLALSDATVTATGPAAFTFSSAGTGYLLSNGPAGGISVDAALQTVLNDVSVVPLVGGLLAGLVVDLTAAIDAQNLGAAIILPSTYFTGAPYAPPCFVRGTHIATERGEIAVENLTSSDRVLLAKGGSAPVVWVGRRRVDLTAQAHGSAAMPVRVKAGALGDGLPRRDLRVSPDHALYLDDVLVPAGLLINGRTIVTEHIGRVEYFHVELPTHDVLLAEGAAAESYLDTGNRHTFANASIVAMVPDFSLDAAAIEAAGPCRTMVLDGPLLAAIRARLDLIAAVSVPHHEGARVAC